MIDQLMLSKRWVMSENIENKSDALVKTIDQEEEYKAWLSFALTDFESAKYLYGATFIQGH